jgi:hypothetical protein
MFLVVAFILVAHHLKPTTINLLILKLLSPLQLLR